MGRAAVAVLLAVLSSPAVGLARPRPAEPPALPAVVTGKAVTGDRPTGQPNAEASSLAAREKQAADLQSFRGGGVAIYIGGGVVLIGMVILLMLIV